MFDLFMKFVGLVFFFSVAPSNCVIRGCLFERKEWGFKLLKSMFNAENFIRRLSGFIFSHFGAICS